MAASSTQFSGQASGAVALSEPEAGDLVDPSLAFALCMLLLVLGVCAWLVNSLWPRRPARDRRPLPRKLTPTRAAASIGAAPARRRRIITLHAVTPGQTRHEYNVGDQQGTTGSSLARA